MDITNGQTVGKIVVNSLSHTIIAAVTGTVIDSFFKYNSNEDTTSTIGWLALETIVKAISITGLFSMGVTGSGDYDDPTGGTFIAMTDFYVSKNYTARLAKASDLMRAKVDSLIAPPQSVANPEKQE